MKRLREKDAENKSTITSDEKSVFFHDLQHGERIFQKCESEWKHRAVQRQAHSQRTGMFSYNVHFP